MELDDLNTASEGPKSIWERTQIDHDFRQQLMLFLFNSSISTVLEVIGPDHILYDIFKDTSKLDVKYSFDYESEESDSDIDLNPDIGLPSTAYLVEDGKISTVMVINFASFRSLLLGIPESIAYLNSFIVELDAYKNFLGSRINPKDNTVYTDEKTLAKMNLAFGMTLLALGVDEERYKGRDTVYSNLQSQDLISLLQHTRELDKTPHFFN